MRTRVRINARESKADSRIGQMTDDGIRVPIDVIDKMKTVSVIGFKDKEATVPISRPNRIMTQAGKKRHFMQPACKIRENETRKSLNQTKKGGKVK